MSHTGLICSFPEFRSSPAQLRQGSREIQFYPLKIFPGPLISKQYQELKALKFCWSSKMFMLIRRPANPGRGTFRVPECSMSMSYTSKACFFPVRIVAGSGFTDNGTLEISIMEKQIC